MLQDINFCKKNCPLQLTNGAFVSADDVQVVLQMFIISYIIAES